MFSYEFTDVNYNSFRSEWSSLFIHHLIIYDVNYIVFKGLVIRRFWMYLIRRRRGSERKKKKKRGRGREREREKKRKIINK